MLRGYNVDVGVVDIFDKDKEGRRVRKQLEVDFVVNQGSQRYYIQVAYDMTSEEKQTQELNSLRNIPDSFKKIIIVNMGFMDVVMFNPVIVSKRDMYETEEGCLSLDGVRKTTRYQEIEVEYYDFNWKKQRQKLSGWTAQICQHEIDHLSGKII